MSSIIPTIVVVDDSATALSLYERSAADLGVDLVTFTSADEAIAYLSDSQPDLLFLDIVMPAKDGLTLLKELRALPVHANTPVIMVTSKDYDQDRSVAKEYGVLEFLLKPLTSSEIRNLISKHTGAEARVSTN